jgi:hypothetical protein
MPLDAPSLLLATNGVSFQACLSAFLLGARRSLDAASCFVIAALAAWRLLLYLCCLTLAA